MEELDQTAVRGPFAELLSRRQILKRASVLGLGGMVASALPAAERLLATVAPAAAAVTPTDATLQAFADTIVPGRKALRTDLGNDDRRPRDRRRRSGARVPSRRTRCSSTTIR